MESTADRFCANCGTEVDADARFCPTCGITLGEDLPDLPPAPAWEPPASAPEPAPEAESVMPAAGMEPMPPEAEESSPAEEPSPAEPAVEEAAVATDFVPEREPAQPPPPPMAPPVEPPAIPPPGPSEPAQPVPPVLPPQPAQPGPAMDLPITWPTTLSGWLIGAGSGIAALALIPRLGDGLSILLFVALLAVTASVFLADRMPDIPRQRLLVLVVTMIGLGIALERAAFLVRGLETLFLISMLVAAGGVLLLELDRDRPVSPPGSPRA